ncbi:MaoC family dehydratase [Stappia sp. GBMRC 2046]|uniref:MaoC family dehydratase n=1 Tax=Stappia sediminis TaxID=2692190 RepID=A0A7X3LWD0_9HYPH|nr:MaoC family dehydratase [Stappia sediminis]MXN66339.1 MaoC family dehydratase [Stappia sediminis]
MKSTTVQALLARQGEEIGVSEWIVVDQAMVDRFAEVTDDRQFIHVDPERAAREGPYGGPVAHGFLTLSLLPAMAATALPRIEGLRFAVNYGFDRIRFVAPVPVGRRVRGHFLLRHAKWKAPGDLQFDVEVTVEIEGQERPALVATWLGRRYLESGETE